MDGNVCTLVAAITAANSDNPVGGCTAESGADAIDLPPDSTHTLTAPVSDISLGYSGLPVVTSPITIEGNNSTVRRESGVPDFRGFTVGAGGFASPGCPYPATSRSGIGAGQEPAPLLARDHHHPEAIAALGADRVKIAYDALLAHGGARDVHCALQESLGFERGDDAGQLGAYFMRTTVSKSRMTSTRSWRP